nr:hypothetical protein [Tanacetum cinerariifolium]
MKELREDTFSGNKNDDAHKHVEKVLDILRLGVSHDAIMLCVFPILLSGAAKRWIDRIPSGTINTWRKSFHPNDRIVAIRRKLDSIGRDIKKLKENAHAIQVGCGIYGGIHFDKECPLIKEVKELRRSSMVSLEDLFQTMVEMELEFEKYNHLYDTDECNKDTFVYYDDVHEPLIGRKGKTKIAKPRMVTWRLHSCKPIQVKNGDTYSLFLPLAFFEPVTHQLESVLEHHPIVLLVLDFLKLFLLHHLTIELELVEHILHPSKAMLALPYKTFEQFPHQDLSFRVICFIYAACLFVPLEDTTSTFCGSWLVLDDLSSKDQENRGREYGRKIVPVENPTENALIGQDGIGGYDWSYQAKEEHPTNYALITLTSSRSSSSLNSEVDSCSRTCIKAYATLKEQYASLSLDYKKSQFNLVSYKAGLQSVEERLAHYKKNEVVFEEKTNILNLEVKLRDNALVKNIKKLEEAEKEIDELKQTLEKFQNSSKSLNNLLENQVSDKVKTGLGYKAASPAVESFVNSYEMLENRENVMSRSDKDIMHDVKTVELKHECVDVKNKGVYSTIETKPIRKNNFSPPITEDWNFDDESEVDFKPKVKVKTVRPSIEKLKFVKTAREKVEKIETPKQNKHYPRGNQRNWNNLMSQRLGNYDGGFVSFGDGKGRISAKVDGNKVIVNEASITRDLRLDDAEATTCLPNDAIFEGLETKVPHTDLQDKERIPTPSHGPLPSGDDRLQLNELMDICTKLSDKVLSLDQTKTYQAAKIKKLKKRVKKLEGKKKRTYGLKKLYKGRIKDQDLFGVHDLDGDDVFVDIITGENVEQDATVAESVEEPKKPLKKKDQIALDEEVARKLEAEIKAEMDEEERIAREKNEANRAIIEE